MNRAVNAGINEYLLKLVSIQSLHERISKSLSAPRPFVRTRNYFGPCRRRREGFEFDGSDRRLVMKMAENKLVLSDEGQYQCTLQKWTQMVR